VKYNLKKQQVEKESSMDLAGGETSGHFNPPEVLVAMGVKPTYKPTKEELEKAQRLIAGAFQLMNKRCKGVVIPGISTHQFKEWNIDCHALSKLVVTGFKSYDDLYKWIEKSINIQYHYKI